MVDFFEEVEEDLRAQRLQRLSRYLPWAGGAVGAVFLGWLAFAGWSYYAEQSVAKASLAYDKGVKALEAGDKVGADRDFAEAEKPLAGGYKALALMQQAGIATTQNRTADAVKDLDAAAKAVSANPILADYASLQAAYRLLDTAPYPELEKRLKPLTGKGRPYQYQALEALAMANLKAGHVQAARADFAKIKSDYDISKLRFIAKDADATKAADVPQDVLTTSQIALAAIDAGDAQHVIEIAKAAASLPPPAATAPTTPSAGSPVPQAGAAEQ